MNRSVSYTRKGKTTATVSYHSDKRVADQVAENAALRNQRVTRAVSYFRDPRTGVQGRLHVVTVRPPSDWQRYAEEKGFGV